jgi:hypothetical protein
LLKDKNSNEREVAISLEAVSSKRSAELLESNVRPRYQALNSPPYKPLEIQVRPIKSAAGKLRAVLQACEERTWFKLCALPVRVFALSTEPACTFFDQPVRPTSCSIRRAAGVAQAVRRITIPPSKVFFDAIYQDCLPLVFDADYHHVFGNSANNDHQPHE